MKEARHIATGRMVKASEVDYSDYYGKFECPKCKSLLWLRKAYTRSDGTKMNATFNHHKAETELQEKCPNRINFYVKQASSILNFTDSKEQFLKVLRKKFLSKLKKYSEVSITKYYSHHSSSLGYANLLISVSHKLIASHQNGAFILTQEEKIKKDIQDKLHGINETLNSYICEWQNSRSLKEALLLEYDEQIKNTIQDKIKELKAKGISYKDPRFISKISFLKEWEYLSNSMEKLPELDDCINSFIYVFGEEYHISWIQLYKLHENELWKIERKINSIIDERDSLTIKQTSVMWLLEFLINEFSDEFIKEVLDYIFGKYVSHHGIILEIDSQLLISINQLLSNSELRKTFFNQRHTKVFSGKDATIFQEIEKIHNQVFSYLINYFIDFPWYQLTH